MPRVYKPVVGPTRRGQYDVGKLAQAVQAVHGGMSQRKAAVTFGVPRGTLQDKVRGRHTSTSGGQPVFTPTEETVLATNIATLGDWGFPLDSFDVRVLVRQYLDARGRNVSKFSNNTPGTDWVHSFLHRQREIISQRMCRNICRKRAEITPTTVGDYFENLRVTLDGVSACNIINYDETNLTDDPGRKKCVYRRGCKYPERVMNSTKASTSIMFAGTATGELLYPYVVYKAEHLHDRWIEGGPPHARYNRTRSGWFDNVCFTDWFISVVVPFCRHLDGKKVIIGDNLASHFSEEVLSKCAELNISFVCLPPNTTHMCQPLDVSVYAPLKKYWRQVLTEWKQAEGRLKPTLTNEWFPRLLTKLLDLMQPTIRVNLVSGFRKCGIVPLDKDGVLNRIKRSTNVNADDELDDVRNSVSHAVMTRLADIQHGAQPAAQRKKRLAVTPGKSISVADLNADKQQPSTSGATVQKKPRKQPRRQQIVDDSSDSDADVESVSEHENMAESEQSHSRSEQAEGSESEVDEQNGMLVLNAGSYVLVRFTPQRKAQPYHYVGKILCVSSVATDIYDIDFLRASDKCFMFPSVKDILQIPATQIVRNLTLTSCQRGRHHFAESLNACIVR